MKAFADVIVDISNRNVDDIFEYTIPDGLAETVVPGTRVLVPFGSRSLEGFVINTKDFCDFDRDRLKPITAVLDEYNAILPELLELAQKIKTKYHCNLVDALRLMIPAEMRRGRIKPKKVQVISLADTLQSIRESGSGLNESQQKILELLSGYPEGVEKLQFMREHSVSAQRLSTLIKKGAIELTQSDSYRTPYTELKSIDDSIVPTSAQKECIDRITGAFDGNPGERFLLRGITGSGKTEVYMRVISEARKRGKTALMLVPEISLTPQMMQRFRKRFGQDVAVLHSGLSVGERFDEWRKLRLGGAHIAVGARSAIFSPLENLGVIIIDEEHEATYRSESAPRYDAIEIAKIRADYSGALLVLGSATPNITHYSDALEGSYTLLELNERVNEHGLPDVSVVDMKQELVEGNRSMFSRELYRELGDCLDRGEQAILFLNRRGYSTFIMCRACSYVVKCPKCDIAMNYHIGQDKLVCHYCGEEQEKPVKCPECESPYIKYFGAGTQKVEQEVNEMFPEARTVRMDIDTTRKKDSHAKIFSMFASGEAQVLIGTQMVAKGLDFPNVTLVGVMAADSILHMPDFSSAERTFQLITQVSGRAGRDAKKGRVIVQTYSPEHYAVAAAAKQDYLAFYREEIEHRMIGEFPPYAVFMRVVFSSENDAEAAKRCREAFDWLSPRLKDRKQEIILLTWMPSPVQRLRGLYRYQIVLKVYRNNRSDAIADELYALAEKFRSENVHAVAEIEPATLI